MQPFVEQRLSPSKNRKIAIFERESANSGYRAMISAFIAIETECSGKLNAEIRQSPRKSNHAGERIESPPATARTA
jgi:hypothetical protein